MHIQSCSLRILTLLGVLAWSTSGDWALGQQSRPTTLGSPSAASPRVKGNASPGAQAAFPGQRPANGASQAVPTQTYPGQPGPAAAGQFATSPRPTQNVGQQPGQLTGAGAPLQASQQVPLSPEQAAQLQAAQLQAAQQQAVQQQQQQSLAGGAVNPVAPFPPLNEKWQAYLDQVLAKWEVESAKVEKFECEFLRYQYDPTLVENDASTIAKGTLKYMKPDKGLFKVTQFVHYTGLDKQGNPEWKVDPKKEFGEYWICDGQYVHILDQNKKECTKLQLPPSMRGNAIHLSPLPFVFGVKKEELLSRYWINPLPQPKDRPNEIWLEVYPRRADDAANYQKLQVVLDLKDWMPKGLIVFLPNYRAEARHRELYQFENRSVNATNLLPAMFQKEFIPADPPKDWKVIIEPYQPATAEAPATEPRVAAPLVPDSPRLK